MIRAIGGQNSTNSSVSQHMNIWDGKLYHSRQRTGGCACSNLFPLVLVEDD